MQNDHVTLENNNTDQLPAPPTEVMLKLDGIEQDTQEQDDTEQDNAQLPIVKVTDYASYSPLAESIGIIRTDKGVLKENHVKRRDLADAGFSGYRVYSVTVNNVELHRFELQNKADGKWYAITAQQFYLKLQNPKDISYICGEKLNELLKGGVDINCTAKVDSFSLLDEHEDFARRFGIVSLTKANPKAKGNSLLFAEFDTIDGLDSFLADVKADSKLLEQFGFMLSPEEIPTRLEVNANLHTMGTEVIKASIQPYKACGFNLRILVGVIHTDQE
jgi:hypothetical protein